MGAKELQYGVFINNQLIAEMQSSKGARTARIGQIVKLEAILGEGKMLVKFLKDDDDPGCTWESTKFTCEAKNLALVPSELWQYLLAIPSLQERAKLASNREACNKLCAITKDITVGFKDTDDVHLGKIMYLGPIRGMGKGHCIGLRLHEKKDNNQCNGSCAGVQYFNCLPGYAVFTTVDRIVLNNIPLINNNTKLRRSEIDDCLERNISSLSRKHEEIVTKFGEYDQARMPPKNSTYIRNSLSLQDIVYPEMSANNANNDFDQNTMIQPDKAHLVKEAKVRNKSEIDLSDVVGNHWHGASEMVKKSPPQHAKTLNNVSKPSGRNKSTNILSHVVDGTMPKRNKVLVETAKFYDSPPKLSNGEKINEKYEKSCTKEPTPALIKYYTPKAGTTGDLVVGSLVEVANDISEEPLYGVVRWMGTEKHSTFVLVGVELEEEYDQLPLTLTDGTHHGQRLFQCADKRALFVDLGRCHEDSRFKDGASGAQVALVQREPEPIPDVIDCPVIEGAVAPLCMPTEEDVEAVCGKFRGIQGHHNSCYLDVTLFSMFTYTAVFDSLLFRPKNGRDIDDYERVQRVLREEIVNPLRKNLYVSADHVMHLRKLLDQLSSVSGLMSEEKDPEEFLNSLLAQILKAEPFLKLNSGQEAFHYQLFVEKDAELSLPTVQQLFEQSFLASNIKLKEVPSCLIIQMPRFGKNYKMYPRILPSQLLDVTDVIEGSPRQCIVCGKLARWECRDCFDSCNNAGLENTAFCIHCLETAHKHERRCQHKPIKLQVSNDFAIMENHCRPPRLYMELFAVICIETSHYVAFVKCGVGHEAPWCFFDSMADRKGEKNGYNIPEMVACPDISRWLSDERICRELHEEFPHDRHLPEHARRLLCDAYICMYQSSDVMMYR